MLEALQLSLWQLERLRDWQRDAVFTSVKALADALEIKLKDFIAPLFVAVAGSTASISVFDSMVILGPDMSRARIRYAIDALGGLGKKKLKKLEKRFEQLPTE